MAVDPVVVHAGDGILDLPNDVKNGVVGYTASIVSWEIYDQ